jgi:hypothetical protein
VFLPQMSPDEVKSYAIMIAGSMTETTTAAQGS